ncbi:hypothetical protein R3W88_021189 [Solanum pinnatisectum]|uniref:Uncharacterized protein n=1 Tax=Solanum pinnatisectum TaxID=50273 RepID=A0AAV9LR45_9SOLN|nr:hypothetical protein R3W88_021189 [Solanum pinnatisectum]
MLKFTEIVVPRAIVQRWNAEFKLSGGQTTVEMNPQMGSIYNGSCLIRKGTISYPIALGEQSLCYYHLGLAMRYTFLCCSLHMYQLYIKHDLS